MHLKFQDGLLFGFFAGALAICLLNLYVIIRFHAYIFGISFKEAAKAVWRKSKEKPAPPEAEQEESKC